MYKYKLCIYKYTHTHQRNRFESPKMNSHVYGQLIFDKGDMIIQWEKNYL